MAIAVSVVLCHRLPDRLGFIDGHRPAAKKMGHNASDTCEIHFDDLELPVENRLGEEGQGYRIALSKT